MIKLNQKDREEARKLAMVETEKRKLRELAVAEYDLFVASRKLWNFISETTGINLHADGPRWRFNAESGELALQEEEKPLYTPEQINGWKWSPLGGGE